MGIVEGDKNVGRHEKIHACFSASATRDSDSMPNASPAVIDLVLDAGPLLSQSQLRGVAQNYYTVPHVISELRDKSAREHLERLALIAGINIVTRNPDTASLLKGALRA